MLNNVSPACAVDYAMYGHGSNPVSLAQFRLCYTLFCQRANLANVKISQFGEGAIFSTASLFRKATHWMRVSSRKLFRIPVGEAAFAGSEPALFHRVMGIFFMRAKEKMVRVNAGRHVTLMANKQPFRDGAMRQYPCSSVGVLIFAALGSKRT